MYMAVKTIIIVKTLTYAPSSGFLFIVSSSFNTSNSNPKWSIGIVYFLA